MIQLQNQKQYMLDNLQNNHKHNGIDSPRLNPKDFEGFPIYTTTVTHNAKEGTIVLENVSGTKKLCAYIGGGWVKITLT